MDYYIDSRWIAISISDGLGHSCKGEFRDMGIPAQVHGAGGDFFYLF
jgi:hypothetical protein